jgi:hypothetical protein
MYICIYTLYINLEQFYNKKEKKHLVVLHD